MQLRMVARRSLSGSMTVVGDIAQATGSWVPASWAQVVEHLPGRRGWRLAELTVNYRTPSEIVEVAGVEGSRLTLNPLFQGAGPRLRWLGSEPAFAGELTVAGFEAPR